jgi:Predicted phosphohydrolases
MKRSLILFLASLAILFCQAQSVLKFNKNGEFKIVQFTDVHFKYSNPASDAALKRINEVLEAERPDLVVLTGDIVYAAPADTAMRTVLSCVSSHKIPFVVTFGNHDNEQGKTRGELYDVIRSMPYNIQPDRGTLESPDYLLFVKSNDGKKDAALLYCFDSHSYSKLQDVKGYDWLTFDQVNWYRHQSALCKEKNGGRTLPALAFFHIPLPEYNEAASDEDAILLGTRMEKACAPVLNSGMFTAMKESGDVMATFVGHDHDNDYSVMWKGILLAYGRFTGGNTEYNHLPNGARVIVLKENARSFVTWIRQKGGEVVNKSVYPDSYTKDDWRKRPLVTE